MAGLILIYTLCGITGICFERRICLNSLLKRVVMVSVAGAGQLLLSIQLLSLIKWLTGPGLILVNLLLTGTILGLMGRLRTAEGRIPWGTLLSRARAEVAAQRRDPFVVVLLGTSLVFLLALCVAGWVMIPSGDSYHLEMPLFWIQNHSALPFPVHNPRIVSLSFLSEGLGLPGFLYARSPSMSSVFSLLSGLLSLWVVFSLARRIGAGFEASACAVAVTVGSTIFAMEPLVAGADGFLAGAWFGASLLFLIDVRPRVAARLHAPELGCSLFCFLMACGAKNSTTLLTPFYLGALVLILKPWFFNHPKIGIPDAGLPGGILYRAVSVGVGLAICGIAGLLCSGVAWNYTANKLWFGNFRGPELIRSTVSSDFHPRSIWTRLCRGGILMIYDTVWIPRSARGNYAWLCEKTAKALGAQKELVEDDEYYSFKPEALTPRKGLGLMGIVFFLPGVALASVGAWFKRRPDSVPPPAARFNTALLVVMTLGAFLMCHLVLRWQRIGVLRLMFPFLIAGAPLCGLLFGKRWLRMSALGLLVVSSAMFFTLWLGNVSRRLGWGDKEAFKLLARLQNYHELAVQYQWNGQAVSQLKMQEGYTFREIYDKLLEGLRQPCSIGFVGSMNAECAYLFGRKFQNRVVPLVDSRAFDRILEPPANLDFLVAVDRFAGMSAWAAAHGFQQVFEASGPNGVMLVAFEKKGTDKP